MQVRLENFRGFQKPGPVDVAPITILLGENSSGKTSFAAGLRYLIESLSIKAEGSFNKEPFFLGAFDQIAHYRGGRAGRAKNFSLGLRFEKEEAERLASKAMFGTKTNSFVDVRLQFENDKSQPRLTQILSSNEFVQIDMKRSELPSFRMKRPEDARLTTVAFQGNESVFFQETNSFGTNRNSLFEFYTAIQVYQYSSGQDESNAAEKVRRDSVRRSSLGFLLFNDGIFYASAPFRTKPERTYSPVEAKSSAEGAHIPILLAQAKAFDSSRWGDIKKRLEHFGDKSQMFRQIDVKRLGHNPSDPFQIIVTVSKDKSNIIDVGYGVSQIIPLLVELLINDSAAFFLFQQPEVHLHPKAQAELGSYLLEYSLESNKYIILESHSDYIIDRIKSDLVARGLDLNEHLSVLFFERGEINSKITRIQHDNIGNVLNPPSGYRSFFLQESARTLGLD